MFGLWTSSNTFYSKGNIQFQRLVLLPSQCQTVGRHLPRSPKNIVAFLHDTTFRPATDASGLIFPYIFNIFISKHTIFKLTLLGLDEIFQIWSILYCNSQQKKKWQALIRLYINYNFHWTITHIKLWFTMDQH